MIKASTISDKANFYHAPTDMMERMNTHHVKFPLTELNK